MAGPHLFVEPAASLLKALAQGRLLLAHRLHLPFRGDALAVGLLPLLLELLVLAGQLAQLLAHGLQLLLAELGLAQLLLAPSQPLLELWPRPSRVLINSFHSLGL